jgi:hypothetical protein
VQKECRLAASSFHIGNFAERRRGKFARSAVRLRIQWWLSTFSTFGTSTDVTIDELRIESMFPADEATAEVCRTAAG